MKNIKEHSVSLGGTENKGCKMLRKISNFMCRCNILSCLLAGTYWATDYRLSRDRFLILLFEKYHDRTGRENMDRSDRFQIRNTFISIITRITSMCTITTEVENLTHGFVDLLSRKSEPKILRICTHALSVMCSRSLYERFSITILIVHSPPPFIVKW